MANDQEKIAKLLRALAECVEKSSSDYLEALVSGRARLIIAEEGSKSVSAAESKRSRPTHSDDDLKILSERLFSLMSREEGAELLDAAHLTRHNLEALARSIDLPVRKEDNIERLRDRIIAATIGARLNSQAIRGPTKPTE
jgi:hypothetical protein